MSLAVLTDSTTAQASPALSCFPGWGNSTNTISVSSCCAWSVMPTVASVPDTRTHSWDVAYFKSEGMFAMAQLSQGLQIRSMRFSIYWLRHDRGGGALSANLDFNRCSTGSGRGRHVPHADADAQGWTLGSAGNLAQLRALSVTNWIVRTRRRRFVCHLERDEPSIDSFCLLFRQDFA